MNANAQAQAKARAETFSVAAVRHEDGTTIDRALLGIVDRLRGKGVRLAGAIRANIDQPGDDSCGLFLEDLSNRAIISLSQNLGSGSSACRLDDGVLDTVATRIEAALEDGADMLILNKFGKQEAEGRGLRGPIIRAVDRGIPVLVGLNASRTDSWTEFCGAAGALFAPGDPAIEDWLGAHLPDYSA